MVLNVGDTMNLDNWDWETFTTAEMRPTRWETNLSFVHFPTTVHGRITSISLGALHSCVVFDNSSLRCFGENRAGQLGYEDTEYLGDEPNETSMLASVDVGVNSSILQVECGNFSNLCTI